MMARAIRLLSMSSITAGMTLLVMSCSVPPQVERGPAGGTKQHVPLQKIAQLNFGHDASFAVCTEPACPAVTRKTRAVTRPAAPALAPVIDIGATLDPGEVPLTVPPRASAAIAMRTALHPTPVMVHFASGSATLSASSKAVLDQALPSASRADHIVIVGRTDNVGGNRANQVLALARARAVRDYLHARLPVRSHTLTLDAKGACCFSASNDTPEGRRQNRRVEIVFGVPEQVAP
jgi:outer membrane protein OmpA-like peptidoglycan-associated protein